MNKVLIAYESEYGYTTQVVNFLKERLVEHGLDVVAFDVKRSQNIEVYPLEQYKGIIIGTCIGVSAFKKLRKTFFKIDLARYKDNSHFVAVFTNSPSHIRILIEPQKGREKYLKYISKKLGFVPDMCEEFKPVLDFTPFSPLDSSDKKVFKMFCRSKGIEVNFNGSNDFRDWNNITAFANNFVKLFE